MSSLPRLPSAGRQPPAGLTTDHSALLHSDQDALDALIGEVTAELAPEGAIEAILVEDFVYHQAMLLFMRRVRAARIEASRRDAIAEIMNAYTPPEDRVSYIGGPGHELATRLIQGDEQAAEEFRALCKKHNLPEDHELHLSYHRASRDMETFDRAVAHHTNMRMRALDALHKGRKSLAARAEVLIEGEAA